MAVVEQPGGSVGDGDPATPTALAPGAPGTVRSPRQLVWRRLRRDRVAQCSATVLIVIVLASIFAPVLCAVFGVDTERDVSRLSAENVGFPTGGYGGISTDHPLGVEPKSGRDLLALLLYGSRNSLLVAVGATVLMIGIGTVVGLCAGYFGHWVDAVLSRAVEILMAFPVLLFSLALLTVLDGVDSVLFLSDNGLRIAVLIAVIGVFSFPYTARLVRGQVLSLRQREFVFAARALGARNKRIIFRELLPNLVGPIIVVASLALPLAILAEAALSFLGVGISPPATSWGQLLGSASGVFTVDPWYMLFPGLTMVVTVLSVNLLGDSIRDALDPRSTRH